MQRSIKHLLWIYFCILIGYQTVAAPLEYDMMESDREISYDFDTEQSQARYDPRLLSEELRDGHSSSQERAAACFTSNVRYEHGEKVARTDPCEMCLCVDGEIFCWWKKCDHSKRKKEMRKIKQQKATARNHRKPSFERKKNPNKFRMMKFSPKKIFSFPEHLPATLHYDFDMNEKKGIKDDKESSVASLSAHEETITDRKSTPRTVSSDYENDGNDNQAATIAAKGYEDVNKDQAYGDFQINQHPNAYEEAGITVGKASELKVTEINELNNGRVGAATELEGNELEQSLLNSEIDTTTTTTVNTTTIISDKSNNNYYNKDHNINSHPDGIIPNDVDVDDVANDKGSRTKVSESIHNEKIQFVDVPLAKHYIITSSGSVENADILASENVLSQFRNGYSIVNGDSMVSKPQADGNVSDALRKKTSTSTNDAVEPALMGTSMSVSTAPASSGLAAAAPNPTDVVTAIVSVDSSVSSLASQPPFSSLSSFQQRSGASSPQADTTQEPARQECVVMGKTYKIGAILPQDTGNCLQCVCIEGANADDAPRVTCSPHNCPPLVLPDLFDTTGY